MYTDKKACQAKSTINNEIIQNGIEHIITEPASNVLATTLP